jgi:hypothetical protein
MGNTVGSQTVWPRSDTQASRVGITSGLLHLYSHYREDWGLPGIRVIAASRPVVRLSLQMR